MVKRYYDTSIQYLLGQGTIFIGLFIAGILAGSIYSINMRENSMLFFTINQYITVNYEATSRWEVMKDSLMVHGKNLLLLWAGGAFNITLVLSFIIFFIICFSYGFTLTCFILIYGLKGLLIGVLAFGLQAVIIIFLSMYIGNIGIRYSVYNRIQSIQEYSKLLMSIGIGVGIVAVIDAYVQPILQKIIYMLI